MKRMLCFILGLTVLMSLTGCRNRGSSTYTVDFYYRRDAVTYGSADSVIAKEVAEAEGHQEDPVFLLNLYLSGPQTDGLVSPFPANTQLLTLSYSGTTATVILSQQLGQLTGMDLTIACACLTLTVMDLTGKDAVIIQANRSLLDGAEQITMDRSVLLLLDDLVPPNE